MPTTEPVSVRAYRLLGFLSLVLLVLAAFYPVLGHEFVEWDDQLVIYQNPDYLPPTWATLGHYWTGTSYQFYVPLIYSIWWVLAHFAIGGSADAGYTLSPFLYHAANFLAHVGSACFAYALLSRLTRDRRAGWLGAALFALHPIHAEAVSWASTLYSPLSGCIALAAACAYFRFSDSYFGVPSADGRSSKLSGNETVSRGRKVWIWFAAFVLLYGVVLITKPIVILLPVIIAGLEVVLRRRPAAKVAMLLVPPMLAGAIPIALLTQGAKVAIGVETPLVLRPLVAANVLAFYMQKIVLPFNLSPDYGRSPRWLMNDGSGSLFSAWLVPFAVFAAAVVAWRKTRWPAVACAAFVLALAPVLGFTPFDYQRFSTVADRYSYFPMIAPAMLVAALVARWPKPWLMATLGVVAIGLGVLANLQTRHWCDTDTFYAYAMAKNPNSFAAHTRAIRVLEAQGREAEAVEHYRVSLEAYPESPRMWFGLGRIYLRQRVWDGAIKAFANANALEANNPQILSSLGLALVARGRGAEAVGMVEKAVSLAPNDPGVHRDAAAVYGTIRQFDRARHHFTEALRLNPNDNVAKQGLQTIDRLTTP